RGLPQRADRRRMPPHRQPVRGADGAVHRKGGHSGRPGDGRRLLHRHRPRLRGHPALEGRHRGGRAGADGGKAVKTAVVICPGRGTYNKSELGYLGRHHADRADLLESFEAIRRERGRETLQALDGAATYSLSRHSRGDNASALIFTATYCDFLSIARDEIEIVAVTGNSMGWYSALACAGALSPVDGFDVVDTMGALMQEALIGGQIVYPFTGEDWQADPARKRELLELIDQIGRRDGHVL